MTPAAIEGGRRGLTQFQGLLDKSGVRDPSHIVDLAAKTIRHLNGDPGRRTDTSPLQGLERLWYSELRDHGRPNYDVYFTEEYLAEAWACWDVYSRRYLRAMVKSPQIMDSAPEVVVDLGCGVGASTAMLARMFPSAEVFGTNLERSWQWAVCELMSEDHGFRLVPSPGDVTRRTGLVFASEYFEHFDRPIDHLVDVVDALQPKNMLIANSFGADGLGHFDYYLVDGSTTPREVVSRLFNGAMRGLGYSRIDTGFWNNRPGLWRLKVDTLWGLITL